MSYVGDAMGPCAEFVEAALAPTLAYIKLHRRIILLGNGGGMATAEHWATDLSKATRWLEFSAPASNAALLTMLANDYGWDKVFEWMVYTRDPHTGLIAFTAGGSMTVVAAVQRFQRPSLLLTSNAPSAEGIVARVPSDTLVHAVPTVDLRIAEDAWQMLGHAVVGQL